MALIGDAVVRLGIDAADMDSGAAQGISSLQQVESAANRTAGAVGQAGDKTSKSLEGVGNASKKLSGSVRPAASAIGLLVGELGAIGPIGNLAGNVMLGLSAGISKFTLAMAAATIGIVAMASAIRNVKAEKEAFNRAVRSNDLEFFRTEVERLQQTLSDRAGAGIFMRGAMAIGDLLSGQSILNSKTNEQLEVYQERLTAIRADRVKDVTDQFKRQTEILGAGDNQVAKFLIEGRQATEDLIKKFGDLGASSQQIQTAASAVRELTAAQISGAQLEFAKGLREQNDQLGIQRIALVSGTEAAIAQSAALLRVKASEVGLTDAIKKEIAVLAERQLALAQANVVDALEKQSRALEVQFVTMTQGARAGRELALQYQLQDTGLKSLTPAIEAAAEKQRQWNERIDSAAVHLRNMQQEIERTRPLIDDLAEARPPTRSELDQVRVDQIKGAETAAQTMLQLERQMTLDVMNEADKRVAAIKIELADRLKVIEAWRSTMIAANQDVEQVNARAAELTALAWESAGEKMKKSAEDTSQLMQHVFERVFDSVADALGEFLDKGFTSLEDFAENIRKTLNKVFADILTKAIKDQIFGVGGEGGGLLDILLGKTKKEAPKLPGVDLDVSDAAAQVGLGKVADLTPAAIQALSTTGVATIETAGATATAAIETASAAATGAIETISATSMAGLETESATAIAGIQAVEAAAIAAIQAAAAGGGSAGGLSGLFDIFDSSSGESGIGDLVEGMGYQHGGHLMAAEPAIVGEAGPELFVPDMAGRVVPNDQRMGGRGVVFGPGSVIIQANDPGSFRRSQGHIVATLATATQRALSRGY
jgi:hypothetical protein